MSSIMDVLILVCGVYLLSATVKMKSTGEIKKSVLINPNLDLNKCKDLEGYKKFLYPRSMALGIATVLLGALGIINSSIMNLGLIYAIALLAIIVVLIWYFIEYRRGVKKFWGKV